jgi:hypothetical protein
MRTANTSGKTIHGNTLQSFKNRPKEKMKTESPTETSQIGFRKCSGVSWKGDVGIAKTVSKKKNTPGRSDLAPLTRLDYLSREPDDGCIVPDE